jgi:hypothetical protein
MATGYAITRRRTLRGLGTTYTFVPRALRGLGQAPPDIGLGPIAVPPPLTYPEAGPQPPASFYTLTPPIVPVVQGPLAPPPNIFAAGPTPIAPGFQLVFPSQGPSTYSAAAMPGVSWLDQTTGGVSNKYLALGAVGLIFLVSMSGAKRRR